MVICASKKKRFLKITHFALSFASTCAVAETIRIESPLHDRPGYYTSSPRQNESPEERRFGDLARSDRKRREAEQQTSRRGVELERTLEQRQNRA